MTELTIQQQGTCWILTDGGLADWDFCLAADGVTVLP